MPAIPFISRCLSLYHSGSKLCHMTDPFLQVTVDVGEGYRFLVSLLNVSVKGLTVLFANLNLSPIKTQLQYCNMAAYVFFSRRIIYLF